MKFLKEIYDLVCSAVADARWEGEHEAVATYNCNDGYIDIWMNHYDEAEVTVNPWIDTGKDHTNIQDAVMEILPQWYDVEVDFPDEEPSDWAKYYNRL